MDLSVPHIHWLKLVIFVLINPTARPVQNPTRRDSNGAFRLSLLPSANYSQYRVAP
ncbi:hypothetical protein MED297_21117 [Reinekea sp. MED297]|uniref:Uncharacterized protein n=1 Tax=Reinekea blandensis MED297 TaxID=314283 RepID=A4B9X8_9GAMM|nr:hypothetical protein MED297_21117 [Reinekea sp. MED297] [Reinekea blandensis MED297]